MLLMPLAFLLFASSLFHIDPIPAAAMKKMDGVSWHKGCPVPLTDLRQLTVAYYNFSQQTQPGVLYVHKDVAEDLRVIFEKLYAAKFLIERMAPVEAYNGNDDASMTANNTSAFNCRDVTGTPGKFSNHSWGRAVDINPLTNPYVKGRTVLPPAGKQYLDRTHAYPGSILDKSQIVKEFESRGWTWGGRWTDLKDYQHFEKPAK
jgi:hypothetical protein